MALLRKIFRCEECGGTNVQHAMWVELNTDKIVDVFGSWCEEDSAFCSDCEKATQIVDDDADETADVEGA